jgi:hypothetical protein
VVVVVEIFRRNFLASMVPVIVNAILNEHQLVIDIVAFVIKGDFHRSRLGEKQRGKILAGWVTRKMRTIAQYSIRDPNGPENQMMISEEPAGRASISMSIGGGGVRAGSTKGSLMTGSTLGMAAQLNSMQLQHQQANAISNELPGQARPMSEAPSTYYPPSIPQIQDDTTPTEARQSFLPGTALDYSPIDRAGPFNYQPQYYHQQEHSQDGNAGPGDHNYQQQTYGDVQVPDVLRPGTGDTQPFYSDSQPYEYTSGPQGSGRWSFDDDDRGGGAEGGYTTGGGGGGLRVANHDQDDDSDDGASGGYNGGGAGGGLRVANRNSSESEKSWARDALASMNFAGGSAQK